MNTRSSIRGPECVATGLPAAVAACAPYAVWMALMIALPGTACSYAARAVASLAVLAAAAAVLAKCARSRPETGRSLFWPTGAVAAVVAGIGVAVLWIAPEYLEFYRRWFVVGDCPAPGSGATSPFDPDVCGWTLALARLAGSAFVIAPAEELFFRFFLYRFLQSRDWMRQGLRRFDLQAFIWSVGLFALEHDRPAAAVAAGAIYTCTYIRFGFAAACVAHALTNFILGVFVLATASWAFW